VGLSLKVRRVSGIFLPLRSYIPAWNDPDIPTLKLQEGFVAAK